MLYTLGRLSLSDTDFARLKPLILLAYIILEGPQSRAHLSQLLWFDAKNPLAALSSALSHLRRVCPDTLRSDQYSVESTLPTDVSAFLRMVDQGNYKAALNLYEGPFLSSITLPDWSVSLESWVYTTREALAAHAQTCLLRLAERYSAQGYAGLAAQHAETAYMLPATPPLEAEALTLIFNLLNEGGHEAAKLVVAEAKELGFVLAKTTTPRTTEADNVTLHNLPPSKNAFVGRQTEIETLSAQLGDPNCQLLTLMGPGGIGKSRLALNVAHTQLSQPHFKDGVYLAALESLASADLMPTRIAEALELFPKGRESHLDLIRSYITKRKVLLVLDNMEHLLEGLSTVSALLNSCPNLKLLVTSRARLDLEDEWVFRVGGLSYPPSHTNDDLFSYDAPKLFVERAKRSRLDLSLTSDEYEDLEQLCKLTGGLPLALEFAASWLSTMSLSDVVRELEQSIEVLRATHHVRDERHQSMEGVFTQSWQRLAPEDQAALRKLSVFEGGFTREAALDVAGVELEQLMRLIATSFVTLEQSGRYGFHPLTKQYLEQRLIESNKADRIKRLHAIYFRNLAERAEPNLESDKQAIWLEWLDKELDNFRATIRWAIDEAKTDIALKLTICLGKFWRIRGIAEGSSWLAQVLSLSNEKDKRLRVKALRIAGSLAELQGELEIAYQYLDKGVSINEKLVDRVLEAELFDELSMVMSRLGNRSTARDYANKSLSIKRSLQDRRGVARSLNLLGLAEHKQGNYAAARVYCEESLSINRALGDQLGVANQLDNLGSIELNQGNHTKARRCYEECLAINQQLGNRFGIARSLNHLGLVEESQKNYEIAETYYQESLVIGEEIGDQHLVVALLIGLCDLAIARRDGNAAQAYLTKSLFMSTNLDFKSLSIVCLENAASIACLLNQFERSIHLWSGAKSLRQEMREPLADYRREAYRKDVATARENLDNETFEAARETGQKMTLEEAVAYALK